MTDPGTVAAAESVSKAVSKLLTAIYGGSPIRDDGVLEAEISGFIRQYLGRDVEIGEFTRVFDEENGWTFHVACRIHQAKANEILVEISKVVLPLADEFDKTPWKPGEKARIAYKNPHVDGASDE